MKALLLLVILGMSGVLCGAVLEACQSGGSKQQGLYLARVKKNLPDATVVFVARKLAAFNLRSVAMAKQAFLTFPEFGREFQRGMDIQFGCCIFGMFRRDTVAKLCKSMRFFFTKFNEVSEPPIANGTIANIQFGQNVLNKFDREAAVWREKALGRVNDTLVRCKGKIFDEIHLEPNSSKLQEYTLTLRDATAVEAFRERVQSRGEEIEDFHFVEISFISLFARMKVESNRKTMTEICGDENISFLNPALRFQLN